MIYVIHFKHKLHHAQHYIGYAENEEKLTQRIEAHRTGRGARIMQVVTEAGIEWAVVATFPGSRHDERRIKNSHHRERVCPLCNKHKVMI